MASDKSPKPFAEKVNVYGPMGAVINEASRVEFSLDKLNFQLLKSFEDRAVAISKKFPLKIDEKIDFFSKSFRLFPIVRTEPFWGDGETNLESICYSALELFDARNHLAHGAIDFIDSNSAGPIYTARKFSHAGAKNTYFLHEYSISSSLLESLLGKATSLRMYFGRIEACLRGEGSWERSYQLEKKLIESRKKILELGEIFGVQNSPIWNSLGFEVELVHGQPKEAEVR